MFRKTFECGGIYLQHPIFNKQTRRIVLNIFRFFSKGKHIATAVNQILPSESVSERMGRSSLHASAVVVLNDSEPQSVLGQETAVLITETYVIIYN